MSKKQKRQYKPLVVAVIVSIIILIGYYSNNTNKSSEVDYNTNDRDLKIIVATVNQEPVTKREFMVSLSRERANVFSYFNQKYHTEDSSDFWTKSFNGEIPVERAKKLALDECTKSKIQLILAKGKGLIQDISYQEFLKGMEQENARRAEAVKNNQPVYGLSHFDENEYFSFFFDRLVTRLKEKMADIELKTGDNEMKQYYEAHKDMFFIGNMVRAKQIVIPFRDTEGKSDPGLKSQALKNTEAVKQRVASGEDFEAVAKSVNITVSEIQLIVGDRRFDPETFEAIKELPVGQYSEIIEKEDCYIFYQCLDKKDASVSTYEEVKNRVQQSLHDEKYEHFIEQLIQKAEVKVNDSVYKVIQK